MVGSKLLQNKTRRLVSRAKQVVTIHSQTWAVRPQRAVIYNRVASLKESENNLTLYLATCRQYAEAQGFQVVREFVDIGSGLQLERTGLNTVRQIVSQNLADTVIIYDFPCLTRSVEHALTLLGEFASQGIRLYSAYRQMEVML